MIWPLAYKSLQGIRLNMVIGAGGSHTDDTGSSRGLSNNNDRELLVHLRSLSDVIVTGGNTARKERYRARKAGSLAVVSHSRFEHPGVISLKPPPGVAVASWVKAELNRRGFRQILLETGPELTNVFLAENLIDEACITLPSARLDDLHSSEIHLSKFLTLHSSELVEGTLFTVWRRGNLGS